MKSIIEAAWNNRELLKSSETIEAIETEEPITGIEVKIINSREELEELNREKK